jgi:hypothetical protein
MNIEVPTKYPLCQDRIIVFEIRLHSKSPMLYRSALHGNWNASSLAKRALMDKFPTPTVPLTTVLQNRQVFLPDPVLNIFVYLYNIWSAVGPCIFDWSGTLSPLSLPRCRCKDWKEIRPQAVHSLSPCRKIPTIFNDESTGSCICLWKLAVAVATSVFHAK